MRATAPLNRRTFIRSLLRASFLFSLGEIPLVPAIARAELFSPVSAAAPASAFPHHYVMLVFAARCTNCGLCNKACRQANNLSERGQRISILNPATGKKPGQPFSSSSFLPAMCNQCSDPPCVKVCPTKASAQDAESGIVSIDRRLCIGCRACMVVCPYMARYYSYADKAVDGCDFCYQSRLRQGRKPACVEVCPREALFLGDLRQSGDPVVEMVEKARNDLWLMRSEKGCRPNVMYVAEPTAGERGEP